jgi:hypothetical protein
MAIFIDGPPRFGSTLETWEQHLELLKQLPNDKESKPVLIADAKAMIAIKKGEASRPADRGSARDPT